MVDALSLSMQNQIQMRFLTRQDVEDVKALCSEWFPIDYPDKWYQDITSNPKFYSLAAVYRARIVGLVIAEVKTKSSMNKEDQDILPSHYSPTVQVAYILTLGVASNYRRHGIASLLLDSLLSYVTSVEMCDCKAVYLHVLSTNIIALHFYERRGFVVHSFLPYYYSIKSKPRDGYSYVLYINGCEAPWSLLDLVAQCGALVARIHTCTFPTNLVRRAHKWFISLVNSSLGGDSSHQSPNRPSSSSVLSSLQSSDREFNHFRIL